MKKVLLLLSILLLTCNIAYAGQNITGDFTADSPTFHVDSATNNVGIGNTSPDVKLEVSCSTQDGIVIGGEGSNPFVANTTGLDILVSSVRGQFITDEGTDKACRMKTTTNHALAFHSNDVERMTISNDGNVGIGDTTPDAKLDVVGDVKIDGTDGVALTIGVDLTTDGTNLFFKGEQVTSL